jgi:putative PIN family toxin of toxin-antitoxin system
MRLVLDTDVVVAAMRSPAGASAAIVKAARTGRVTILMTVAMAMEYEAVCLRPEHRLPAGLSTLEVEVFLDAIVAMGEPVRLHYLWRPQLRDPNDEMVLEAAINGEAEAIVTFNVRDYGEAAAQFGVAVLRPREALARIEP